MRFCSHCTAKKCNLAFATHLLAYCFCKCFSISIWIIVSYKEASLTIRYVNSSECCYFNTCINCCIDCFCSSICLVNIYSDQVISLSYCCFNRVYLVNCIRLCWSIPFIVNSNTFFFEICYCCIHTSFNCIIPAVDVFVCAVNLIFIFLWLVICIKVCVCQRCFSCYTTAICCCKYCGSHHGCCH